MLKASLHLILVLACCCSAAAADDEDPSVTTTSTTITVLALNHRPSPFLTSEINALALQAGDEQDATQQERLTSLPQSSKALPPSTEKKHRPGTVTNLGVINLDEEVVKQLAQRGPSNHKSVEATTTEVTLVTVNPRPTKRISTAGGKRATSQPFGSGILRNEPWVLPLLVLSAIVLFTMTTFEVFVLCRAKSAAPSRRHLFLGQMLLLGVFMCVLLAALQALTPSFVTCAMTRLGVGLAYAIVFATLLVKSVFLISLNGGVYLPAPYQALLLLFAVLIQVAVGSQWLLNAPPRVFSPDEVPITKPTLATPRGNSVGSRISTHQVITASDVTPVKGSPSPLPEPYGVPLCATAYEDSLASLIYVVFLMGFVGILAAKSRGIRENYRESTYIGLSIACCAPLWLGWALAGLALAPRHQDASIGFGLLATGVVVFSLMFLPRGRQLAAMGRDGRYAEDGGEERFSSLSPSAMAGYSPSFFHFKPAPAHTVLTSKNGAAYYPPHLMGDRVALVPAPPLPQKKQPPAPAPMQMMPVAPPSYPRLLHYYPYLVYPPRYHPGPGKHR
ncbi:Hypothetical predicted protein [Cloeon dipterum]|uniref:G-protein coupled receptors family 3 profile domain-containing protein n=1 Tax=Cloeon dipterum TaxID=197152 RepID=A0A8S1DGY9_9INSE|nr:Hypothetical predicted protein [Cloeon dipterum]